MSATYRTVVSTSGTSTDTSTGALTGISDGDLMIALLMHSASSASMSTPASGWTSIEDDPGGSQDFSCRIYYRVKQSGDSAPSWVWDTSGSVTCDIIAYSAFNTSTPIDASVAVTDAIVNTITVGPVTPSVTDCLYVGFAMVDASGTPRTWTETGTPTERIESFDNNLQRLIWEEVISTSGSGISRDATVTDSAQHMKAFAVLIAPASGGGFQAAWAKGSNALIGVSQ